MDSQILENEQFQNYEETMYSLIQYMFNNSIFNTYVTTQDSDTEFSIILRTHKPKLNDILSHLGKYHKIKDNDAIVSEICPICYDEFKVREYKRTLDQCSHCFHKKCIDKWFRKNQDNMNCPICRKNYNKSIKI